MPKLLIFLFVILIPAQTSAQDGSVESLLARVIAAHGGAENLQKTRFAVQSGKIFSHRRGETVGRVTRTLGGPENFLIEISYPEEPTEIRLLAGAKALRDGAEASGPLADAMRLQAARIALPYLLVSRRSNFRSAGMEEGKGLAGGRVHYLELDLADSLTLRVGVDEATGLIASTRGRMSMQGQHMDFTTAYSDHREFDGVVLATRENQFAMGRPIGRTEIEQVLFPDKVPAVFFAP